MERLLQWRYQKFHPSYLLGWLAVGLLTGLGVSRFFQLEVPVFIMILLIPVMLGVFIKRRWWHVAVIVILGVIVGIGRGSHIQVLSEPYQALLETTGVVQGTIGDDPEYDERGGTQFRLTQIVINDQKYVGEVYVSSYSTITNLKRGDRVVVSGKITEGFGGFQAVLRPAQIVDVVRPENLVNETRDNFAEGVRKAVSEPMASLGLGFVVGQRSALPPDLDDQLRMVGLTHIVVASGYNLTILVRFARRMLAHHSKYLAAAVSSGLMVAFVAFSGVSPSMSRASIVTGLSLLAWYYGRRFHPLLLILYVAAGTALYYPVYLWSDLGWHLSFLAFAGVLLLAPMLTAMMFKHEPTPLIKIAIETVAAQIMTLPLILLVFGQLPLFAVLANVLIAPLIPLAMVLITLAGIGGMIAPALSSVFGIMVDLVIGYMLFVVERLTSVDWAVGDVTINVIEFVILLGVIVGAMMVLWRRTRYDFRRSSIVE